MKVGNNGTDEPSNYEMMASRQATPNSGGQPLEQRERGRGDLGGRVKCCKPELYNACPQNLSCKGKYIHTMQLLMINDPHIASKRCRGEYFFSGTRKKLRLIKVQLNNFLNSVEGGEEEYKTKGSSESPVSLRKIKEDQL